MNRLRKESLCIYAGGCQNSTTLLCPERARARAAANTDVEKSKFSIEKTEDGIRIDIAFTALIRSQKKGT